VVNLHKYAVDTYWLIRSANESWGYVMPAVSHELTVLRYSPFIVELEARNLTLESKVVYCGAIDTSEVFSRACAVTLIQKNKRLFDL
jgi:hypothetical protein